MAVGVGGVWVGGVGVAVTLGGALVAAGSVLVAGRGCSMQPVNDKKIITSKK